ncbi:fluoride efflux transporter FluC [Janibacter sp. Soil728]|uniref:fluoride efflux transporter FluC n=1 Tax=Janibacter sp. Soil728 TaxID=1736393 RepID=UPI0009EB176D|nr:CrcB family protein [Janibacter sp. Soil728]
MSSAPPQLGEGGTLAAVAAGGAIGSLGRWGVASFASGAVWATLLVNLTGALAMGLVVAWLARSSPHSLVRPFLTVGLLGGWTTYSSFALDAHGLAGEGLLGLLGYLVATLGLGVGAAMLGLAVGDRLWHGDAVADDVVAKEEL